MKVFELMNQLKNTKATAKQIESWMYMNRIHPYMLRTKDSDDEIGQAMNSLELETDIPQSLVDIIKEKPVLNDESEIKVFLNKELTESWRP